MADVDISKEKAEAVLINKPVPKITFGPNGELNDRALLEFIQRQKPLTPAALLKEARHFDKFPPTAFLAQHLLLSAMATIVGHPELQQPIQTFFNLDGQDAQDSAEDSYFNEWKAFPVTQDQDHEDPNDGRIFFVPLSEDGKGGLLAESRIIEESNKVLFFALGVAPNPTDL